MLNDAAVDAKDVGRQRSVLQLMRSVCQDAPLDDIVKSASDDVGATLDPGRVNFFELEHANGRLFGAVNDRTPASLALLGFHGRPSDADEPDQLYLDSIATLLSLAVQLHDMKVILEYQDGLLEQAAARSDDDERPEPKPGPEPSSSVVEVGRLRVDLRQRTVLINGKMLELPPMETALLIELAKNPDGPISAEELGRRAWPQCPYATADDVRRHIYRLRRSLGDHERNHPFVRNRRGFGYLLDPQPSN